MSLLFFATLLPFQVRWLPITLGMMLFGLFWLLSFQFRSKLKRLASAKLAGLAFLYYLIVAIGCFYSPSPAEAEEELLLKIPFVVWPLLLASTEGFTQKQIKLALKIFMLGCAASMLYSFADSFYSYLAYPDKSLFYFENLVNYAVLPPHYLGMYVNFSYGLLLIPLLKGRSTFGRIADSLLLLFFFVSIVFIAVRMQYIVFAVLNAWLIIGFIWQKRGKTVATVSLVALLGIFFGLVWSFPGSRGRLIDTYNEIRSFQGMVDNKQTNPRKFLWREGWNVVEENFWTGTGTGGANQALDKKIADVDARFWDGTQNYTLAQRSYNYHNTYLQHFAAHGILGIACLLALFLVPVFQSSSLFMRQEALLFVAICALSFLTESMLQRQAGVLFFSFFYALFFVLKPQKHSS